jgi:hypothetical protein
MLVEEHRARRMPWRVALGGDRQRDADRQARQQRAEAETASLGVDHDRFLTLDDPAPEAPAWNALGTDATDVRSTSFDSNISPRCC